MQPTVHTQSDIAAKEILSRSLAGPGGTIGLLGVLLAAALIALALDIGPIAWPAGRPLLRPIVLAIDGGLLALAAILLVRQLRRRGWAKSALQDVNVGLRDFAAAGDARETLRWQQEALERMLDSAIDAIISIDDAQRIVIFNPAAERVFGWSRADALGQPLEKFIPERYRRAHRDHIERFGKTGVTARRMGDQTTLVGLRANGSEFPIDASISQVDLHGHRLYTVILRDVTERVRAQEELRRSHQDLHELASALQTAREQEKARIARELHDELGQGMTALKFDLAWLGQELRDRGDPVEEKLRSMGALLDHVVAETRRISADLRPLMLDDLGFAAAAEWLVAEFRRRSGVACDLVIDPLADGIVEPSATALFRALQESLTNVTKHAQARRVDVSVMCDDGWIRLEVCDDGRGISEADRTKRGSSGLRGLAQRAAMLGGDAKVASGSDGGTRVLFRVPMPGPETDEGPA